MRSTEPLFVVVHFCLPLYIQSVFKIGSMSFFIFSEGGIFKNFFAQGEGVIFQIGQSGKGRLVAVFCVLVIN